MSNARENRIKQLEEENRELHKICQRQRDSLAAQQEVIVQLNISLDSTLACLANIYGAQVTLEDGTQARQVKIPAEDFPGVLDNFNVGAVMFEGHYVITVAPKPQDGEEAEAAIQNVITGLHETKTEQEGVNGIR